MKQPARFGLLVSGAALAAFCVVGGTYAWFTSVTAPVNNTISLGKVDIALCENEYNPDGTLTPGTCVQQNDYTDVLPGFRYLKNPSVEVATDNQPCYLFLRIAKNLRDFEAASGDEVYAWPSGQAVSYIDIAAQLATNGWLPYTPAAAQDGYDYYSYGTGVYTPPQSGVSLPLFANFAVDAAVTQTSGPGITLEAAAVQGPGIADLDAAFNTLAAWQR